MSEKLEKLKKFIIEENHNLEKLNLYLSNKNYFEILGISTKEHQHSNFLSWLLNPKSSHNINDYFLKSFINLLNINSAEKIRINLTNLNNTTIKREYKNIDLLIINEELKFVICIENKINAKKTGENQLIKYYDKVEEIWNGETYKKYYVYLTPYPRNLTYKERKANYINISYLEILNILQEIIEIKEPAENIKPLIINYIKNLEKNIMGISEEVKLAQEIYNKHKNTIDFIYKNRPNLHNKEIYKQVNDYFKKHEKYTNLTPNNSNHIVRILPKKIENIFALNSKSWKDSKSIFALELFFNKEKIWMKFCFGIIGEKDENKKDWLQEIKTTYFNEMKRFHSLKEKLDKGAKPTDNYPAIATTDILKISDDTFWEMENELKAFKIKFKEIETQIIDKWTIEVEERLTKYNILYKQ